MTGENWCGWSCATDFKRVDLEKDQRKHRHDLMACYVKGKMPQFWELLTNTVLILNIVNHPSDNTHGQF